MIHASLYAETKTNTIPFQMYWLILHIFTRKMLIIMMSKVCMVEKPVCYHDSIGGMSMCPGYRFTKDCILAVSGNKSPNVKSQCSWGRLSGTMWHSVSPCGIGILNMLTGSKPCWPLTWQWECGGLAGNGTAPTSSSHSQCTHREGSQLVSLSQ